MCKNIIKWTPLWSGHVTHKKGAKNYNFFLLPTFLGQKSIMSYLNMFLISWHLFKTCVLSADRWKVLQNFLLFSTFKDQTTGKSLKANCHGAKVHTGSSRHWARWYRWRYSWPLTPRRTRSPRPGDNTGCYTTSPPPGTCSWSSTLCPLAYTLQTKTMHGSIDDQNLYNLFTLYNRLLKEFHHNAVANKSIEHMAMFVVKSVVIHINSQYIDPSIFIRHTDLSDRFCQGVSKCFLT